MKIKILVYSVFIVAGLSSCKKFLTEYSQNLSYVNSPSDLNELLIQNGYMQQISNPYIYNMGTMYLSGGSSDFFYPYVDVMSDDASELAVGTPPVTSVSSAKNLLSGFHRWQPLPFINALNSPITDYDWRRFYGYIAGVNAIVYKARDMRKTAISNADISMLNKVEAECLFLRASYYFLLENIYGKPYAAATAATDYGVPLKTSESVEDHYFTRATVAQVYAQMLEDLKASVTLLQGVTQPSIYRVNQAAANTLLSRVYLYMERYSEAAAAADAALNSNYVVTDLNSYTSGSNFTYNGSSEITFSMGGYQVNATFVNDSLNSYTTNMASAYKASSDIMSLFNNKDLRLNAFFTITPSAKAYIPVKLRTVTVSTSVVSSCFLIRQSEALLNKAEAQALSGENAGAQATIQLLRAKRFKPADLTAVTVTGESLVNFIREERRRELCFEGQRWFDLRRYAVNSKYPYTKEITHEAYTYDGTSNYVAGVYKLKVYSQDKAAYVIPIPAYEIEFNSGTLSNETRPDRAIQ